MKLLSKLFLLAVVFPIAASQVSAKEKAAREIDAPRLKEQLNKGDMTAKTKAAETLSDSGPDDRKSVEDAMEKEKDPETRRRIAQILAAKHKHPRAIAILRQSMHDTSTSTQGGAFAFVMSAMALKQATDETSGIDETLALIKKPAKFADVPDGPLAYAKRDGVRTLAASYLVQNLAGPEQKGRLKEALGGYLSDVEKNIKSSSGQERKYWEARLTTLLEMSLRADIPSLVSEFENKKDLVSDKYQRERLDRSVDRAKVKK